MMGSEQVEIKREVEASVVPSGTRVTLEKGEAATITQSVGGTFTVVVNGNMFRIDGKDADALGKEPQLTPAELDGKTENPEDLEKLLNTVAICFAKVKVARNKAQKSCIHWLLILQINLIKILMLIKNKKNVLYYILIL